MYIHASSAISHQESFQNPAYALTAKVLTRTSELLEPSYKPFIPAMARRRMSPAVRMAVCAALDCLEQSHYDQPKAIIVGTAMGCCIHTEQFLEKIEASQNTLLSPTAFITSTQNTIAGQISLRLKNHEYNITHSHNSLSFEHALIDTELCLIERKDPVIVGASDEAEGDSYLYNLNQRLKTENLFPSSGAAFYLISTEPSDIKIKAVDALARIKEHKTAISNFVTSHNTTPSEVSKVLYAVSSIQQKELLSTIFEDSKLVDYQDFIGSFFTNAALAMHFAIDLMKEDKKGHQQILILNWLLEDHLGLILLEQV